jgi:hypothetical protein
MDTVIGDCDSASSGEDERKQRLRRYALRTVMSAVAEAGISDNSPHAPRSSGSVPGRLQAEIESYYKGSINVDMDYFNRLNLVIVPRLEPECERCYRMPRSCTRACACGCWRRTRAIDSE